MAKAKKRSSSSSESRSKRAKRSKQKHTKESKTKRCDKRRSASGSKERPRSKRKNKAESSSGSSSSSTESRKRSKGTSPAPPAVTQAKKKKAKRVKESKASDSEAKKEKAKKKSRRNADAQDRKRAAEVAAAAELAYASDHEAVLPVRDKVLKIGMGGDTWLQDDRLNTLALSSQHEHRFMAMEDLLSSALRKCEALERSVEAVQAKAESAHGACQAYRAKLRTFATATGKIKQVSAKRLEKRDARIKSLEGTLATRDGQINALASSRQSLLKTITRLKQERLERDEAESDMRDVEPLPHRTADAPQSAVKRAKHTPPKSLSFVEGFSVPISSFRHARLWIARAGSKVCCDSCDRTVPTVQGFLLSDPARSRFMQDRFLCTICLLRMQPARVGSPSSEPAAAAATAIAAAA